MRGGDQRSAGGEHRIDEEALAAGQVLGQTVRVRHLLGGVLLVALHAQEADFSSRNQAGHAVEHAQASAQHRHDDRAREASFLPVIGATGVSIGAATTDRLRVAS